MSVEVLFGKTKSISIKNYGKCILASIRSDRNVWLAIIIYIIVLSTFTILRQRAFLTSGFDLGIFNQAFSTTLHQHKLFYETGDISFNPNGSFLGVHFSPILTLILPLYALWPTPENLLVMQTTILALGALPIYWLTSNKLGKNIGFLTAAIYLISPLVLSVNLIDFHLEAFTSTFFLFSLFLLERERWFGFSIFFLLALSTIEFAPFIGFSVAVYTLILCLRGKFADRKKVGKYIIFMAAVSLLFLILAFEVKSALNPLTSPIPTPFQNILQNPAGIIHAVSFDWQSKMLYLIFMFAPLAFLPFLAVELLIMIVPWIGASLLSSYYPYYSVYYQYLGFVIPFIFIALAKAVERLNLRDARKIFAVLFAATIIFSIFIFSAEQTPWNYQVPISNDRTQALYNVLPYIPANASVLTANDLFPHVSDRADAYMYIPQDSNKSIDYVFVDIASSWYTWQQPYVFGDRSAPNLFTEKVLKDGSFGVLASDSTVLLLKRGFSGEPMLFKPFVFKGNYNNLITDIGTVEKDNSSISGKVLFHNSTQDTGVFWHGPYSSLPTGLFKVTYALKINDTSSLDQDKPILMLDAASGYGQEILGKEILTKSNTPAASEWFNATLYFGLTTPSSYVEFRGFVEDAHNISLDYILVEQISPLPTKITYTFYDSADLSVSTTGVVSQGIITHQNGTGIIWYGPYSTYPKGNYTAEFWLKMNTPQNGNLLNLTVTSNSGKEILIEKTISDSDFKTVNVWQRFDLNFSLPADTSNIEFVGKAIKNDAQVSFFSVSVHSILDSK